MEKSDLFELIDAVQGILIDELPIIVGSQATFALTDDPPEIALESIECDFLIYGIGLELISPSILVERLILVVAQVENDTIPDRVSKFKAF